VHGLICMRILFICKHCPPCYVFPDLTPLNAPTHPSVWCVPLPFWWAVGAVCVCVLWDLHFYPKPDVHCMRLHACTCMVIELCGNSAFLGVAVGSWVVLRGRMPAHMHTCTHAQWMWVGWRVGFSEYPSFGYVWYMQPWYP